MIVYNWKKHSKIEENELGIRTDECMATIIENNFIDNTQQAQSINCIMTHPLIAMDFGEIDKKCMELGILE